MRLFFVLTLVISLSFGMVGCKKVTEGLPGIDKAPAPTITSTVASGTVNRFSDGQIRAALASLENIKQKKDISTYKFREGDKFTVSVMNHPDWETRCTVLPGGLISVGYLDKTIQVSGKTISETIALIKKELEVYFTDPLVKIDNIEFSLDENTVNVIGFFRQTGKIGIDDNDRIMDIVTKVGGIERKYYSRAGATGESGKPAIDWNRAHIARYNETKKYHEIIPYVNLYELLVKGDYKYNIKVRYQDIICLPEATFDTNKVFVLGAVNRPGVFSSPSQLTLIEALSLAGSFDNRRAEERWVYIIRNSTDQNKIQVYQVPLRDILTGVKNSSKKFVINYPLQENDIIFVDTSGIVDFGDWLRDFQPFWGATLLSASSVAYNVSNLGG